MESSGADRKRRKAIIMRKFRERKPWYSHYYDAKTRCENKKSKSYYMYGAVGIKLLMTMDDMKNIWFRDKAYLLKQASVDRIDSKGNYEIGNIRFIEFYDNSINGIKKAWGKRTHCKRGHLLSQDNVHLFRSNNRKYRRCKLCHRMINRKNYYASKSSN